MPKSTLQPTTNSRSSATKRKIIDTSYEVFSKKGVRDTTIDDICKACDLGTGTLYLYFGSKWNLYDAVCEEKSKYWRARLLDPLNIYYSVQETLEAIINNFLDAYDSDVKLRNTIGKNFVWPGSKDLSEEIIVRLLEVIPFGEENVVSEVLVILRCLNGIIEPYCAGDIDRETIVKLFMKMIN